MRSLQLALVTGVSWFVAACGAGTAAAVSGGGGGGGGNSPPSIASFRVLDANDPQRCRVEFALRDPNGDPATVELLYQVPGQSEQRITRILPVAGASSPPANPATLPSSANGVEYAFQWDFAGESSLPHDGGFVEGASVFARVGNTSELLPGANVHSGIGNDAPVVVDASAPKAAEVAGITAVPFTVADTSGDAISIRVEYDVIGDAPDIGWRVARPAGIPASLPTPEVALSGVIAPPSPGVDLVFFWDTNFDLHELELDVALRFTPADSVTEGVPFATQVFRVDNNAAPSVTLREGQFIANGDGRRGIVIPFTVSDDEHDAVDLAFQWRRSSEAFVNLPADAPSVRAILADPELRQQYRICSELPSTVAGQLGHVDATTVELPELAGSAAHALAHGIVGRELELLRPSSVPRLVTSAWSSNPLAAPVAALPLDGGANALVLDAPAPGSWRIARLQLATGKPLADQRLEVASGAGAPTAMCFERGEGSVLVASDRAGAWRVDRVGIQSGDLAPLCASDRSTARGPIRGIVSLGTNACLVTVGSSLLRLEWSSTAAPRVVALFDDLETPWGLALDPANTNRIFVAEREARTTSGIGRILAIQIDTLERHALRSPALQVLDDVLQHSINRPAALAFDRAQGRLLAVTEREIADETHELLAIELDASGASRTFELRTGLPASTGGVAIDAQGTIVVARTSDNALDVGGGVEQRRTITAWDPARRRVTLTPPLEVMPSASAPWRIEFSLRALPGTSEGSFLWDSHDVPSGGDVLVRITPLDAEVGAVAQSSVPKHLLTPVEGSIVELANPIGAEHPIGILSVDIDGDGDSDLVSANRSGGSLSVFRQTTRGEFETPPTVLTGGEATNGARSVAAADLDGDGDHDLVCASEFGSTLSIFWQVRDGTFDPTPMSLGGPTVTPGAYCVSAADIDRDGDVDIVSANIDGDTLTVFWQSRAGAFDAAPTVLGSPATTDGAKFVVVADVDQDGRPDLVCANEQANTLSVFWQIAAGAFDPVAAVLGGSDATRGPRGLAVADLDHDGDFDVASANELSDTLSIFWQTAARSFDPAPTLLVVGLNQGVVDGPVSVVAADVDLDGDLDLTSSNIWNDTLSVYWQTAAGVFDPKPAVLGGGPPYIESCVVVADVDGDRDLDLVSANESTGALRIWRQSSRGSVAPTPQIIAGLPTIDGPLSLSVADVDQDGDLDIVSANRWSNTLTAYRQLGAGVFDPVPVLAGGYPAINAPCSTQAIDVDGDGDLDLVAADFEADQLTVFRQLSSGTFEQTPIVLGGEPTINTPQCVEAADVDGDGGLDLVSANLDSHSLTVFWHSAIGDFDPLPTVVSGWPILGPAWVTTADVDRDGDLDLVSANGFSSALAISWQTAPRVFDPLPTLVTDFSEFDGPLFVTASDVDRDGDVDLVSANRFSHTLKVFWQTAAGSFDPVPSRLGGFPTIQEPHSVATADFDGDGDLDLISANYLGDTLSVFWQQAAGVFDPVPLIVGSFPSLNGPRFVEAVDVDLDGDLDLVSANFDGKNVTVFWGGR